MGDSPAWILYADILEHSICSIFTGRANKKNNWDETARVFIQVKVWLKRNLGQLEGGGMERGHIQVEEKAVDSNGP